MDFSTTGGDSPIPITIDGTKYALKRFLLPAFKEWAAEVREERKQEILAEYKKDEERAHQLTWWQPPVQDMGVLVQRARSPEGMGYVLDKAMKVAGVPDDARAKVLEFGDPMQLMDLSAQLTMSKAVLDKLNAQTPKADQMGGAPSSSTPPLTSTSSDTSGGSPTTGTETKPDSEASTT